MITSLFKKRPSKYNNNVATSGGDVSQVTREVLREGLLMKRGEVIKNWKERHFVLTSSTFEYFEPITKEPLGFILLSNAKLTKCDDELFNKKNCFQIVTKNRTLYVVADSDRSLKGILLNFQCSVQIG